MPPVVINLRKAEDRRDVVHRAVQALSEGQLVAFPTETVYGLAASARCAEGVRRIYEIKGRDEKTPLTLAIRGIEDAWDYVPRLGKAATRLARRCWPGPVTLVAPHGDHGSLIRQLPAEVRAAVAPSGDVGLRSPAHPAVLEVLQMIAGPIVLTSANRSGQPPAVTAEEVVANLGSGVALVLDDGPSRYGQASTVVRVTDNCCECLREGVVPHSALQRLASMMIVLCCTGNTCRSPMAEAILRRLLAERLGGEESEVETRGVLVSSAGIAASPGGKASPEAVAVMTSKGLDISGHASQPLTENLVRDADLVLTMTSGHRQAIVGRWPESASRVKTLRPDLGDIDDPIGAPEEVYRQCAEQIEAALRQRVAELDLPN
ncbi:MAG: threonylcarbamoyl-AMP synthase [Planctomycetales bacterium]|nr:threonylcarbamoyl-AMP synthase [Planctomycetales bacterium]